MLTAKFKPIDEILASVGERVAVVYCSGCSEISVGDKELSDLIEKIGVNRTVIRVINTHNACNTVNVEQYQHEMIDILNVSDSILVASCGVGVQMLTQYISALHDNTVNRTRKGANGGTPKIEAACDTYNIPGYQGLTPLLFDCEQCGQCHLNETGGICPVTSCSKGLINGQCGGAKSGMCEVDPQMQCGWERIYRRIKN